MKNNKNLGIRFKLLAYFLGFSLLILLLLWLMQVVFLQSFYKSMKRKEIEKLGAEVVSLYQETPIYNQYIRDVAFKNEVTIIIFDYKEEQNAVTLKTFGGVFGSIEDSMLDESLSIIIEKLDHAQCVSVINDSREGYETLTFGATKIVNAKKLYFYVHSSLAPVDSTTAVLTNQLGIVTTICISLSLIVSFGLSKKLSKPIVDVTNTSKFLAEGDFSKEFSANGYEEIESLCVSLNYARRELEKTDNLRKDLVANVSHELRTPLTMIQAYAEMIRDISGDKPKKREEHLEVILEESERLKKLVNDVLDLSKLQSGLYSYNFQEVNFSESLNRVVEYFRGAYSKDGFEIIADIDENIILTMDISRVEQVIYNLIGNAINYSTDNKIIHVTLKNLADTYRLDVIDNGKGIDSDELSFIFDRYFRVDKSKNGSFGTGLGLSIVKTILEKHNYLYGATSEVDVGSDFYFIIPKSNKSLK